ncbi:hypothetical protein [Reichenbachiella versicolor]|uniref:hypothetical protein n=1 Tax=Reichenbachiella versicolor TaxID=1821036 RepID=UPI000D6E5023|nr:hypothetical protein [Reichenbachiella versicolor]
MTFGYQNADFDPEHIEKREVDLNYSTAIALYSEFPWEEQYEKVERRRQENLSSTSPTIYFYLSDEHFLSISSLNSYGFYVYYKNDDKCGSLSVSNDSFDVRSSISVNELIEQFFSSSIDETLELFDVNQSVKDFEKVEIEFSREKGDMFLPLLFMFVPITIFTLAENYDLTMIGVLTLLCLVAILPSTLLNLSYWNNDSRQKINYLPQEKKLIIDRNGIIHQIHKSEITSIKIIKTPDDQRVFDQHTYTLIKSRKGNYIITHLTISPMDLVSLIQHNYQTEQVLYPKLSFEILTSKQKKEKANRKESKKQEFLDKFKDYETGKLEEIIKRDDYYAEYAIEAAQQILDKRSK